MRRQASSVYIYTVHCNEIQASASLFFLVRVGLWSAYNVMNQDRRRVVRDAIYYGPTVLDLREVPGVHTNPEKSACSIDEWTSTHEQYTIGRSPKTLEIGDQKKETRDQGFLRGDVLRALPSQASPHAPPSSVIFMVPCRSAATHPHTSDLSLRALRLPGH